MKTLIPRLALLAAVLALAAPLPAAAGGKFKPGTVYREWTGRLAELGMLPVFPPREDIVVGDVYLLPMHPMDSSLAGSVGGLGLSGIRISYLNLEGSGEPLPQRLLKYYTQRPTFPDTPAGEGVVGVPRLPAGTNDGRANIYEALAPTRLKQVAFPEFSVTSIREASAAAMVPIEAVLASASFDYSKVDSVTLRIPRAESYGLSSEKLLKEFFEKSFGECQDGTRTVYYLRADGSTNSVLAAAAAPLTRAMFTESMQRTINDPTRDLRSRERRRLNDAVGKGAGHL
ncbi:MAG: hypothetical protein ACKVYV_03385, partial [Limisphaerales bacterium]